jgi:hypothetical protein
MDISQKSLVFPTLPGHTLERKNTVKQCWACSATFEGMRVAVFIRHYDQLMISNHLNPGRISIWPFFIFRGLITKKFIWVWSSTMRVHNPNFSNFPSDSNFTDVFLHRWIRGVARFYFFLFSFFSATGYINQ